TGESGAPLLGGPLPALGGGPLRASGDQRRSAGGHVDLALGRGRGAGPLRGTVAGREPAGAPDLPAGGLVPLAAALRADPAATPDGRGPHREPAPVPVGRRGPDRDDLPVSPRRHLHLREPRLLRGLRPPPRRAGRREHLAPGPRRR